jgi:hypothetical protein
MLDGLKRFDRVIVRCDGEQYAATVAIISPNGKALALTFEAIIDGHVGTMPVTTDDAGNYFALVTGKPIELKRWETQ